MELAQTVPADPEAFNDAIEVALVHGHESNEAIDALLLHYEAETKRLHAIRGLRSKRPTLHAVPNDYTAKEAAAILGLAKSDGEPTDAGYRVIGEIGYKAGREWRVEPKALDAYRAKGGKR